MEKETNHSFTSPLSPHHLSSSLSSLPKHNHPHHHHRYLRIRSINSTVKNPPEEILVSVSTYISTIYLLDSTSTYSKTAREFQDQKTRSVCVSTSRTSDSDLRSLILTVMEFTLLADEEIRVLDEKLVAGFGYLVPYYAGLDFRRNIRRRNIAERDAAGKELSDKWLKNQPQWKGISSQDYFFVIGRISRDFRRNSDNKSGWGTNLMLLPDSPNLSFLTIERSPTSHNEFSIPYPTYFHPNSAVEFLTRQNKIKLANQTILFSFAGAQRPSRSRNGLVRTQVISNNARVLSGLLRTGEENKIEDILREIPNEKVLCTRENVIKLIPTIVYTKPNCHKPDGETLEDVFDVVKGVMRNLEGAYGMGRIHTCVEKVQKIYDHVH
ncbi:hypothetical protein Bca4012_082187 [Brassica carinata]